jgi:hypothetical protein
MGTSGRYTSTVGRQAREASKAYEALERKGRLLPPPGVLGEVRKAARLHADLTSAHDMAHKVAEFRERFDPSDVATWPVVEEIPIKPRSEENDAPPVEVIARRAARYQRQEIVSFLRDAEMSHEVKELTAVERRLRAGGERDLRHAAFSARTLLHAIADGLFPARVELWQDASGRKHKVGAAEVGNRLSAYVEQQLGSKLEPAERRAFQGELDGLMRWTGAGPHGAHNASQADLAYFRLLSVLAVIATAYRSATGDQVI